MAWLYQRPGSKKWWIGWRANGQQFLKSTGKEDKAQAHAELDKLESMAAAQRAQSLTHAFYESLTGKATPRQPISAEAEEWLGECTGSTAKGTLTRYRGIIEDFLDHLQATPTAPLVSEVTDKQVRAYLTAKLSRASVSTVNLERKNLSGFFGRAVANGIIQANPVAPIKRFKNSGDEIERRNLTLEEIGLAYSKAPNDFWRFMIVGGFYSGLREGDLITLDWRNVDFAKMLLRLKAKKRERRSSFQSPLALGSNSKPSTSGNRSQSRALFGKTRLRFTRNETPARFPGSFIKSWRSASWSKSVERTQKRTGRPLGGRPTR